MVAVNDFYSTGAQSLANFTLQRRGLRHNQQVGLLLGNSASKNPMVYHHFPNWKLPFPLIFGQPHIFNHVKFINRFDIVVLLGLTNDPRFIPFQLNLRSLDGLPAAK